MDLCELPGTRRPTRGSPAPEAEQDAAFRDLVGQLGREVATPMSSALERVVAFAASGRIDRSGLDRLRLEIESARRLGLMAQQISRFAAGRVRQQPERLNLTQKLRDALAQRSRETSSRGIDLHQQLKPAEVMADASLLSALLQAVLDWCFEHARSQIDFSVDVKTWPTRARLGCRFAHTPADEVAQDPAGCPAEDALDSMAWKLVRQLALNLELTVLRDDDAGNARLVLEFPHTVGEDTITLNSLEVDTVAGGLNSQPMVGRHVLVIASRRETRNSVRETLRPMGLMVDYVTSIDEARQFCSGAMPHAIIYEAALAGENFRRLRADWCHEVPTLVFIEIEEQGRGLQVRDIGGQRTSHVGRDAIADTLPNALLFELSRDG